MDIAASKLGSRTGGMNVLDNDDRYAIEVSEIPKQVIVGQRVSDSISNRSISVVQGVELDDSYKE